MLKGLLTSYVKKHPSHLVGMLLLELATPVNSVLNAYFLGKFTGALTSGKKVGPVLAKIVALNAATAVAYDVNNNVLNGHCPDIEELKEFVKTDKE